ncbi:hypothetical protein Aduo_008299 [Ancylostoma duodenale]
MTAACSAQGMGNHTMCYCTLTTALWLRASNEEDREPLAINVSCCRHRLQPVINREIVASSPAVKVAPPFYELQ